MTCKLCGANRKLVKSHVIPQALHKDMQEEAGGEAMHLHSDILAYDQRSGTGVYDRYVCANCEDMFHSWDEYGIQFVRDYKNGSNGSPINGNFDNGFLASIDYEALKLWVMSMLWRAHACGHDFYGQVDLGSKWLDLLEESIKQRHAGDDEYFAVTATLFAGDPNLMYFMANPYRERFSRVNYYRFYVYGGFTFFIKVDKRGSPHTLREFRLRDGHPFAVTRRGISKGERRLANSLHLGS